MVKYYKSGDPFYTLEQEGRIVGMIYCSRYSKGGNLENLAIDPDYRGLGLSKCFLDAFLRDNPGVVTLTTRLPDFFVKQGFQSGGMLQDGSTFMYRTGHKG
jgi:N-acetylglutamate synthase-like GNAT family acetyltransferase